MKPDVDSFQTARLDLIVYFAFPRKKKPPFASGTFWATRKSVLYEVESFEANPPIADINNGLLNAGLVNFDENVIAYYWRGWQRSPDPEATILREVLLRTSVTISRVIS
jgi:hypothetical protein